MGRWAGGFVGSWVRDLYTCSCTCFLRHVTLSRFFSFDREAHCAFLRFPSWPYRYSVKQSARLARHSRLPGTVLKVVLQAALFGEVDKAPANSLMRPPAIPK